MKLPVLFTPAAAMLAAGDYPQAEISNGSVRAKLHLPDARRGYYRAARFEWSGQIANLEFQGHQYFGRCWRNWSSGPSAPPSFTIFTLFPNRGPNNS
jgi:hypothetical protein